MKTGIYFFLLLFLTGAAMTACSSDDNDTPAGEDAGQLPSEAVKKAFAARYPTASAVEWEQKGLFQKAEFEVGSTGYEAWFRSGGVWLQTRYSAGYTALPPVVKDLLANSINYPPDLWTPQASVEVLERTGYPLWYGIELEKGTEEVTVWSDEDAWQSREVQEDFDGDDIPQAISGFVDLNYRKGLVTEVMQLTNTSYIANLLDGSTVKEIYFNRDLTWEFTQWPVLPAEVPEVVMKVLDSPAYAQFSVRSVVYQQYPAGGRYHFALKQEAEAGPDVKVNIDPRGNIILN